MSADYQLVVCLMNENIFFKKRREEEKIHHSSSSNPLAIRTWQWFTDLLLTFSNLLFHSCTSCQLYLHFSSLFGYYLFTWVVCHPYIFFSFVHKYLEFAHVTDAVCVSCQPAVALASCGARLSQKPSQLAALDACIGCHVGYFPSSFLTDIFLYTYISPFVKQTTSSGTHTTQCCVCLIACF